jgi:phosphoribosylaminoimidazole carboxylase (NCAIR synthetase)
MGTIKPDGGRIDIWGVEFTPTDSTGGMALPVPGNFILKDITKWRDVVKAPDVSNVDWEMVAKKAVETAEQNKLKAQIDAETLVIAANAEAQEKQILAAAVANNPNVLTLEWIKKWDGKLPQFFGGTLSDMILNLDNVASTAK